MPVRYIWIPVLIAIILVLMGFYYVSWSKSGDGAGLYSRNWNPTPVFAYWNPDDFYTSVKTVTGEFSGEQCIECHQSVTPGIVNDWKASRHSQADKKVYCNNCHGNNHEQLHMPTPDICATCHNIQYDQFMDEKKYGFPSHALAMERALDTKHFADKPKAEVTACLQCHSVATKCDSCHTRHRFSAAEARRPEACITCHSGPPHPDDETYFNSKHGQLYLNEGSNWDWNKPLTKNNYPAPTCAYCHMNSGKHQVADKSIWQFGIKQVNPLTSANQVKREQWTAICDDCHQNDVARNEFKKLDAERKMAWKKLYAAESILKNLRNEKLFYPAADERPRYPFSLLDKLRPHEHIGFFEGQASAFYNVSPVERDYFEMWYFDNLAAYKGAAHNDPSFIRKGHDAMDAKLIDITKQADKLIKLGSKEKSTGKEIKPGNLWFKGQYTEYNQVHN